MVRPVTPKLTFISEGITMENWIATEVIGFLISICKNRIEQLSLRIRYGKLKRTIAKSITDSILKKYGNECFYDDLDRFLLKKKALRNLLSTCYYTPLGEYRSSEVFMRTLSDEFIQNNYKFITYKSTIEILIFSVFKIVFDSLNSYTNDETIRIVLNNTKELVGNLQENIQDLSRIIERNFSEQRQEHQVTHELLRSILNTSNGIINDQELEIGIAQYYKSISRYFLPAGKYINRQVSQCKERLSVVDQLIAEKHLLLLGEPGCGKSYESLHVLEEIYLRPEFSKLIVVYMPLSEYGIIYDNLISGITSKLKPYIFRINPDIISLLLKNGELALVLDGADEIATTDIRARFFLDVNNILSVSSSFCFITSRINQYHGNIKNIRSISLSNFDRDTVQQRLRNSKIQVRIPDDFYTLLSIPLFLDIGIKVLSKHKGKFYNKSQLLEQYVDDLFFQREAAKGLTQSIQSNFHVLLLKIGEFSYKYWGRSSFSHAEFDAFFSSLSTEITYASICDVFRIDVFRISGTISFSHKQFAEYFAAYYLVNHFPYCDNSNLYSELMEQEEWQEVMIFVAGMINSLQEQNNFLDCMLVKNLHTYIKSVYSKRDLSIELALYSDDQYTEYYFRTLLSSFNLIVWTYFPNIESIFQPSAGVDAGENIKRGIWGIVSNNRANLTYWFDWVHILDNPIQKIERNELPIAHKIFVDRAGAEHRSISSYTINLEASRLAGDSARIVAIERVKSDLSDAIKQHGLIESNFLLCERVNKSIKHIKELQNHSSIDEMLTWVRKYIQQIHLDHDKLPRTFLSILYGKIEIYDLESTLEVLENNNTIYMDCILPQPDKQPEHGWVWEFYSHDQTIKYLECFFHWVTTSYTFMINQNFPKMRNYFPVARDEPYKYKLLVSFSEENNFNSDPRVEYFRLSVPPLEPTVPEINVVQKTDNSSHDIRFDEIRDSFEKNGRTPHKISVTQTGFSSIFQGHGLSEELPLANFVYNHLRDGVDSLFSEN